MYKIVLLRHGESVWNKENKFTGWTDVDLSEKGKVEARVAGDLLKKEGFRFDHSHTSFLKRAIRTLWIVLDQMDQVWIPVEKSWRLNERHYGALQGLNKSETAAKYGEEQVHIWRRGYDILPPLLEASDERSPAKDFRYRDLKNPPLGESLKTTVDRMLPYWEKNIAPQVLGGASVLVAAHGNSLRALVKHFDKLNESQIMEVNIPTGIPLVYELDAKLQPIRHYYLGDQKEAEAAAAAVSRQGKK